MLGEGDPQHWAIYRNDANMAVQCVWEDLACTLTGQQGAEILIHPPDKQHKRRTALRSLRMIAWAVGSPGLPSPTGRGFERTDMKL